jgi:hypothetical protein
MTGWGDEVAARVRFVFSAEPVVTRDHPRPRGLDEYSRRPLQLESEAKAAVAEIARGGPPSCTRTWAPGRPRGHVALAHEQGSRSGQDYWEFVDPSPSIRAVLRAWSSIDLQVDERIQSSPLAVERRHGAIGGAYISQNITTLELRFNRQAKLRRRARSTTSSWPGGLEVPRSSPARARASS